ncbi:zincin [Neoconidiobolus thromboides FSU 785]|nr:zincin [Neoconidiobolus thromboides FSU 785]
MLKSIKHLHNIKNRLYQSRVIQPSITNLRNYVSLHSQPKRQELEHVFNNNSAWQSRINPRSLSGVLNRQILLDPSGFDIWYNSVIQQAEVLVDKIVNVNNEMDAINIIKRVDRLSDLLCSIIDFAEFVRCNHPNKIMVEKANNCYLRMVNYMNQLNTKVGLYVALKKVLEDQNLASKFTEEEKQVGILFLKDFEKSGIHLDNFKRNKFVQLNDDINELGRLFMSYNQPSESSITVSKMDLDGCETWWFNSQPIQQISTSPSHANMLLRTAHNPNIRKRMYIASNTGTEEQLNILENLLITRLKLAELLGYSSFSEFYLEDKMGLNPTNINNFLNQLNTQLTPNLLKEVQLLQKMKGNKDSLMAWDQNYYIHQYELLTKNKNHLNLNQYFSIGTVIQGLSDLLFNLYGIYFEVVNELNKGELWDLNVRKLIVKNQQNQKIGLIYMDLFYRPNKSNHAAHYTVQCSRRIDNDLMNDTLMEFKHLLLPLEDTVVEYENGNKYQLPVVVISTCFSNNNNSQPSLLEPNEVETLFHEMGHAIHSMLARTEYHNVSGTRCKIDFVELPSILMETFALNENYVTSYAKDYQTGESIKKEQIINYKQQHSQFKTIDTQHQIILSLIDQNYHSITNKNSLNFGYSNELLKNIINQYSITPYVESTNFSFKFNHLFSYSATYYSYLLGRVLANKLFQLGFNHNNLDKLNTSGEILKENLLKFGGSKDPWDCIYNTVFSLNHRNQDHHIKNLDHLKSPNTAMKLIGTWGLPEK